MNNMSITVSRRTRLIWAYHRGGNSPHSTAADILDLYVDKHVTELSYKQIEEALPKRLHNSDNKYTRSSSTVSEALNLLTNVYGILRREERYKHIGPRVWYILPDLEQITPLVQQLREESKDIVQRFLMVKSKQAIEYKISTDTHTN